MTQNRLDINVASEEPNGWLYMWDNSQDKNVIGHWYLGELATFTGDNYSSGTDHYGFTSELGRTDCCIPMDPEGTSELPAYSPKYAQWEINSSRYVFYVRRKCRIFVGENELLSVYSGDAICTDGNSSAGLSNPDRLSINGYRKTALGSTIMKSGVQTFGATRI